ncbi:MAG: (d)CMP kinase [Clostridia bacterium]|nr:(d)CMP kinase [Clostridia bacterium]
MQRSDGGEKHMKYSIAIDGPAGAGKSTVAQRLAKELNIPYLNTGAMYRALAFFALEKGIALDDKAAVAQLIKDVTVTVFHEGDEQHTVLNGFDCTDFLRSETVSQGASKISKLPVVRDALASVQRQLAQSRPMVLEGRDIGTNVLFDTPYKFYVTASAHERTRRRVRQLLQLGQEVDFDSILSEIISRDERDTNREYMPLRQAEDAVLIDTTELSIEEAVNIIKKTVEEKRDALLLR